MKSSKKGIIAALVLSAAFTGFSNNKVLAERSGGIIGTEEGQIASPISNANYQSGEISGAAGAIYNRTSGAVINGTTFDSNSAKWGGAIGNYGENTSLTINNSIFSNNTSTSTGSAIDNDEGAVLNINSSEFTNNKSTSGWGGVISTIGTLNVSDSTFDGNSAVNAGVILDDVKSPGAVSISDSIIKNTTVQEVGAIALYSKYAASTIDNVQFLNNTATYDGEYDSLNMGGAAVSLGAESRVTIKNSTFTGNQTNTLEGGAIGTRKAAAANNSGAKLDILNSTFTNNSSNTDGGAIENNFYNSETNEGSVTISGSTFTSNTSGRHGGAIFNNGVADKADNKAAMTISNSTFKGNTAITRGGAVYNAGTLTVEEGKFEKNTATYGGAIRSDGTLTISNSEFNDNGNYDTEHNTATHGGALFVHDSMATISKTKFEGNSSTSYGGAIYAQKAGSDVTINEDSSFKNNSSERGGAIIMNITSGTLAVNNSIFSGNHASISHGAINKDGVDSGAISISNSTFEENYAAENGAVGIFTKANSSITNSTFKNNYTTFNDSSAYSNNTEGGGALSLGSESKATISGSTFEGNTSTLEGGAITTRTTAQNNSALQLSILNSTFTGNKAGALNDGTASNLATTHGNGGAIYANAWHDADGNDSAKITGSTFTSNSAYQGGAIYNDAATGKVGNITITDSTFTGNTATEHGGAIYNEGKITFTGTNTFSGNKVGENIDDINGDGGTINIAGGTTTVSTIKNQTVGVNAGELHLTTTATDGSNIASSTVSVSNGAVMNTIDGVINDYMTGGDGKGTITLANGAKVKLDTSLSGTPSADKYIIAAGDSVTVNEIKVLTDTANASETVNIADAGNVSIAEGVSAFTTDNKYTILGNTANSGEITLTKAAGGGVKGAADSTEVTPATRDNVTYSLTGVDSTTTAGAAEITNADMTIIGAGDSNTQKIVLSNDLTVGADSADTSTLTLNEVKFEEGDTAGKIVNNEAATLNIKDSIIGVTIQNKGTLISDPTTYTARQINDGTATYSGDIFENIVSTGLTGGAIYNTGTLTIQKEVDGSDTFYPTFENNMAKTGGAIYNSSTVASSISDAVFTNNYSTAEGGAIYVAKDSAQLTINDSTFTGNGYKGTVATTTYGGAIYSGAGTDVEINDSTFTNNIAKYSGGAIYVKATNANKADLSITDSTISSNTANGVYGGGGMYVEATNTTLDDTDVTSNTALKAGGGIYNRSYSALIVKGDSHIDNNKANTTGGGIHNQGAISNSVTITASSVSGNTSNSSATGTTFAEGNGGGGIYSVQGTLLVQNGSKINNNTAKNSIGGGIESHAIATINASEVKGNRAVQGAGIYNKGTLTVTNNSTISENIATAVGDTKGLGGGIYNTGSGSVTIENSTFSGNQATNGGGAIISVGKEYTDGTVDRTGTIDITGGTFTANKSTDGSAGAIGAQSAGNITIDGVAFGDGTLANANTASTLGGVIHSNNTTFNIKGTTTATSFDYNTAANGGAISAVVGSTINIENTAFNLNKATADDGWGGAIYANNSVLNIYKDANDNKTYFTNNTAYIGGAIGIGGTDSELSIKNAEFESNTATSAGGAIYIAPNIKSAIIDNVKFGDTSKGNTAGGAAGAVWFGVDGAITNSTFTANSTTSATSDGGGAIFVGGSSDLNIINSSFTNNSSQTKGGAIATRPVGSSGSSSLNITGDGTSATEFNGNSAANGGAIWTEVKTVIANTNFTNNTATTGNGGAISHTATDSNRLLAIIADGSDVTFSGNTANSVANDIHNTGRLDLIAAGTDDDITFGGGITGGGDININKLTTDNNTYKALNGSGEIVDQTITSAAGSVIFNGDVLAKDLTIAGGTLQLAAGKTITASGNVANSGTFTNNGTLVMTGGTIPGEGDEEEFNFATITGDVTSGTTRIEGIVDGTNATIGALEVISDKGIVTKTGNLTGSIANDGTLMLQNTADGTIGAVSKLTSGGGEIILADVDDDASTGVTYTTSGVITDQKIKVEAGNTLHLAGSTHLGSGSTVKVGGGAILDTLDSAINDYTSSVQLKNGATVKADISATGIDSYGADGSATSVTLGAINSIADAGDFTDATWTLVDGNVTVTGESLYINTAGKTIAVEGSGSADGKVKVAQSSAASKLNGAVDVSGVKNAITYSMAADETVNQGADTELGRIQDTFILKSDGTTLRNVTSTDGRKGLIVDSGKSLEVDYIQFNNFANAKTDSADTNYEGTITNYGTLKVNNSYFSTPTTADKIAIANYGTFTSDPTTYKGAVANYAGATATITGDTFSNIDRSAISGANGGAIYNENAEGTSPAGILTLNTVTATGNKAVNGGALYNAGTATINGGTYSGNSATALGGAIYSSANLAVKADETNGAVSFSNNKHQTATTEVLNDIYMKGADASNPIILVLKSKINGSDEYKVTLGSGVDGVNYNIDVNEDRTGTVSIAGVKDANTIALQGGELDLTADSNALTLNASDATTLKASSTSGLAVTTLTVADNGTFTNEGNLTVTSTLNNGSTGATGTITNTNGTLNLLGGTSATAPMTNIGTISGGNINIGSYTSATVKDIAYVVNSGSISGEVLVAKESTLQTAANTVTDTNGISNAGTLTLTGGNLASAVSGDGVTNITGEVTNTDSKAIANALEVTNTGKLTTSTTTLTSSTTTKNAGTLVFNNTSDGELKQSITNNGTNGTVEIAATDGVTIDMNGKTITNNTIKLTSGTLKATGDSNGNVDLTGADKIVANGGTLNVQDGKMGTINLGVVDTATNGKDLNVAIDADFMHDDKVTENDRGIVGTADVINAASVTGTNKILVSNISLVINGSETNKHSTGSEFTVKIASGAAANAMDVSNTTTTITSYRDGIGSILLDYDVDSAGDGYMTGRHSTLNDAITSSIDKKMFFMDGTADADADATITGPKTLNGTSLAITTNGNNISLDSSAATDSDGIIIGDASRTLSIIGTAGGSHTDNTTISGFGTAIDNTAGGRVNLTDVTMTSNAKDIVNDGEGTDKGVFLEGTNNINSIVDSDSSASHGQTTVAGGTSTIDAIKQNSVTVDSGATANLTNVDNVATTDGITNNGDLVLAGGTADTAATNNNEIKKSDSTTGNAKTTIAAGSNIINDAVMTQKEVVVSAGDESTTPATPAAKLTNEDTINADTINIEDGATLDNNDTIAAADGSSASAINVKSNADLNLNADSNSTANVTLDAATSDLTIKDNGALSGDVISDNGGSINLVAGTQDITMSDAISGAIKGSDDPVTGDPTVGSYVVTATSTPQTAPATPNTVTIDKAIAGATEVDVNDDTVAVITDTAYTSTTAPIKVGDSGDLTLKNTTTGETAVGSAISALTATDKFDVTVDNSSDGTTNINNTISGAKTVTGDGGTTNLNSTITGANAIIADSGTTNINTGSGSNTSAQIGSATVDVKTGATAGVNTTSDNFVLDNNVTGEDATSTLKLSGNSGTAGTASDPGTQFNIASNVNGGTVEISQGQLNLPNEDKVANADGVRVDTGATLNTMNGSTTTYNTNTEFEDASQVKVDVNAISKSSDRFANPQQTAGDGVVLTDLALQDLDKVVHRNTDIDLRGTTNLANVTVGSELLGKKFQAMTPIRIMEATIDQNGMMNIHPSSGRNDYNSFNPAAVVAPIAAQMGGYLSQLNSYDEAFRNLDMKMLMTQEERQAYKMANRYASEVTPQVFSETYLPEKSSAGWFRPYASFERVGLKHGPGVSNVMYGSYFGGDSQMKELRNGWDYQWSVYVGYNGSHQAYAGQSIYQNGGNLGATGVWYKNNFFTALTANVGASVSNASTTFGSEDFPMLMTGVASKTGYNWELAKGKFIIQPSYLMSYTFVNTFDYTNAAGVRINSDPLHAINITPGLKFIGNLKNGWQPYAGVQMVWSIMDQTNFHANDIPLPQMSVKPYFQYGVGIQKRWGERFTGFFQAMLRNGGRNGVALSAGFRWALGKDSSDKSKSKNKVNAKKTTVKEAPKKIKSSSSVRNTKTSNFFANMNGEPTYVVSIK